MLALSSSRAAAARLACERAVALRRAHTIAAKERPLSPHLAIYKFQMNMIASVVFRGTGLVMAGGLSALAIASLPSSMTASEALWHLQQYPAANAIVKFGVVFPLTYHYLGGLRHLAWDHVMPGWHSKHLVNQSAYGALAAAGVLSVAGMFVEFKNKNAHTH